MNNIKNYYDIDCKKLASGVAVFIVETMGSRFKVKEGEFLYAGCFPENVEVVIWMGTNNCNLQPYSLQIINNVYKKLSNKKVNVLLHISLLKCTHEWYMKLYDKFFTPKNFDTFWAIYAKNQKCVDELKSLELIEDFNYYGKNPSSSVDASPTPFLTASAEGTSSGGRLFGFTTPVPFSSSNVLALNGNSMFLWIVGVISVFILFFLLRSPVLVRTS